MVKKEITITYTVEVCEIVRGTDVTEKFVAENYSSIISERMRNELGVDYVSDPKDYKFFVRDLNK